MKQVLKKVGQQFLIGLWVFVLIVAVAEGFFIHYLMKEPTRQERNERVEKLIDVTSLAYGALYASEMEKTILAHGIEPASAEAMVDVTTENYVTAAESMKPLINATIKGAVIWQEVTE